MAKLSLAKLERHLDHISFMRTVSNKRVVSDDACKDLVRHFSRHRLRNEDFQFSDLLGAAYEFLINMFAESAGKKGVTSTLRSHFPKRRSRRPSSRTLRR